MPTPTEQAHLVLSQLIKDIFSFLDDGSKEIGNSKRSLSRALNSNEISGLAVACGRLGLLNDSHESPKLKLESAQQELQLPFRILPGAVDSLVGQMLALCMLVVVHTVLTLCLVPLRTRWRVA